MPNKIVPQRFLDWLHAELDQRGWSYRETARRAGLSHGSLSQIANGRQPGFAVCLALSRALGYPLTQVLWLAGYIERPPGHDPLLDELAHVAHPLPAKLKRTLIQIARSMNEQEEQ